MAAVVFNVRLSTPLCTIVAHAGISADSNTTIMGFCNTFWLPCNALKKLNKQEKKNIGRTLGSQIT